MSTLVFFASPNKNGNTKILLNNFLKGLEDDVSIINVYDVNIKPCIDCGYCKKNLGKCSINDDMNIIYEKIENSSNIVIACPMYFGMMPAPLKNVIDRAQMFWNKKYLFNVQSKISKKGVLLFTGGAQWKNMFSHMEVVCRYFFKTIDCKLLYKVYVSNTDNVKVSDNKQALKRAKNGGIYLKA